MDYSRQNVFINPDSFKGLSVAIIGCGATGSHAALLLAQSGFGNSVAGHGTMKLFDFDKVEEHNLPNQAFHKHHIGMSKVSACCDLINSKCGFMPQAFDMKVVDQLDVQADYVFLLVDSMKARKEIAENCLEFSANTKLVIETRMGLTEGRCYAFDPRDAAQYEAWTKSLYDDDKAETSACGTSLSCAVAALDLSNKAVQRMIQHIDWTVGQHYLEKRGYANNMPFERIVSLFPDLQMC